MKSRHRRALLQIPGPAAKRCARPKLLPYSGQLLHCRLNALSRPATDRHLSGNAHR